MRTLIEILAGLAILANDARDVDPLEIAIRQVYVA
jgi:hypothetical protein